MKIIALLSSTILVIMLTVYIALGQQANGGTTTTPEQLKAIEQEKGLKMLKDPGDLARYREADEKLGLPAPGEKRVIFIGDSITDGWSRIDPDFFAGKLYVNRGIGGQTTPQMLVRFRADIIDLKASVVVILGGINDILFMPGPYTLTAIKNNLISMVELAKANDIRVVLCSLLPAHSRSFFSPDENPGQKVMQLNPWIKEYAENNGCIYVDYFTPLVNETNEMKKELTSDGIHPNLAGYKIMDALVGSAIQKALEK
jgi:lysophospholipase L1-like esterase